MLKLPDAGTKKLFVHPIKGDTDEVRYVNSHGKVSFILHVTPAVHVLDTVIL